MINLNGMTWDQLIQQAGGWGGQNVRNAPINLGGTQYDGHYAYQPTRAYYDPARGFVGSVDSPDMELGGVQIGDPNDSDYHYVFYKNPDGSVGQDRQRNTTDLDQLMDFAKFAAAATGMGYGISSLAGAGAGATSGAGSTIGTGASGAGTAAEAGSLADAMATYAPDWAGQVAASGMGPAEWGAGTAALSGGAAAADEFANETAKLAAQNAAAPGSILNTSLPTVSTGAGMDFIDLLSKGGDFLTSKAGSAILGGLLGGAGSKGPDSSTTTAQSKIDPRMDPYIYGENGILQKIMANQSRPQSAGLGSFGSNIDSYLGQYGRGEFDNTMRQAGALRDTRYDAPSVSASQINAPSQNNLNLAPAYQDMVYGQAGNNPYLTGAIQKGINQSNNAFGNYLQDATKATQDLLGNIRGGAIVNGQMGGSRQGIAEGRALSDFGQNISRAASQYGQNNTDAAVSAQAGAYDADRNRALTAMSGLGAQQYGVATNNAQLQQQANLANMQSQLNTNALNSDNLKAGVGLTSGLLGQAYNYGTNQDQYAGQKLGQTSGLLGNFTGLNSTQSQTTPLYNNTAGGVLGGALAGMSLYNAFNK